MFQMLFLPKISGFQKEVSGILGGAQILFYPKFYFFCDLKPHAKFQNPRTTTSGRKVTRGKRKKQRKREKTSESLK